MTFPSTPHCCDVWPKIAGRFFWFDLAVDGDVSVIPVSVMPSLFADGEYWRINYCPACGAPRRDTIWNREAPSNA